jgi:predicted DNA-binding protein (MmcQ/YjbR family)
MDIEAVRIHALSLPHVTEDFPFGVETLVFRVHKKIFLLTSLDKVPASFNAKCEPALALDLRERHASIKPGWHMNKKHWSTIILDDQLDAQLVRDLITHSYLRVVASLTRAQRAELGDLPEEPELGQEE